jgi:hypothetical protein
VPGCDRTDSVSKRERAAALAGSRFARLRLWTLVDGCERATRSGGEGSRGSRGEWRRGEWRRVEGLRGEERRGEARVEEREILREKTIQTQRRHRKPRTEVSDPPNLITTSGRALTAFQESS